MTRREQNETIQTWLSRHKGLLLKVVRSFASTPHDQDDLFQEITLRLWDSIPRYKQGSAETTWIYQVSLHAAINWSKRERRVQRHTQSFETELQVLVRRDESPDHRLDWLYEQISKLDEVDRSLTLLMLDGLSYREMADTLGISISNVGVKISRIKKHLSELSSNAEIGASK